MEEKNKNRYGAKIFWLLMESLALAIFAMGAVFLIMWFHEGYSWKDNHKSYLETEGFANNWRDNLYDIKNGIQNAEYLEKARKLANPVLDVDKLQKSSEVSFQNISGFGYKFEDLLKWQEEGWSKSWDDPSTNIVLCYKEDGSIHYFYYKDFIEKIKKKELVFGDLNGCKEEDVMNEVYEQFFGNIQTMKDKKTGDIYHSFDIYMNYQILEKYKPDGAESILEIANRYPDKNLESYFHALDYVLNYVSDMKYNQSNLNKYTEGNTNISYMYVDLGKKEVISNVGNIAYENYESVIEEWEEQDIYVHFEPELEKSSTNTSMSLIAGRDIFYDKIQEGRDFVFVAAVDKKLPIKDEIAVASDRYSKYIKWVPRALAGMIISGMLFLVGIISLTIMAGKKGGDRRIHLNFFDHLWTEIAAILIMGIWIFVSAMMMQVFSTYLNGELESLDGIFFATAFLAGETALFFMIGYLSLVRRIKAGTMWKNSATRFCLLWIKKILKKGCEIAKFILKNAPVRIKTVAGIVGFCFLQFLLSILTVMAGSIFCLFLLAGLDLAVLIYCLKRAVGRGIILDGLKRICGGELQYKIPIEALKEEQQTEAEYINRIGEGLDHAVEESIRNERMKTELITNVSHDIKTPLTSIINYVELLKRENLQDPKVQEYIQILEEKSKRLKVLTEDVVEASKASTGNISIEKENLNLTEMLYQVSGEYEEKLNEKGLKLICQVPEKPAIIYADGRRMWRILENIFGNVYKYAMEGTRVYADIADDGTHIIFSLKNISAQELNISADDLTERFIRGDLARNTEGSGLGLSIAKSLTELQGGRFHLYLDGDLFKVEIQFPSK